MLNFGFATLKRHILARNRVFWVFWVNVRGGVLAQLFLGNETPHPIWIKFCWFVGTLDIITCWNFRHDRLRYLGVGIKFFSPHRLSSSSSQHYCPIPRECVIFDSFFRYNAEQCRPFQLTCGTNLHSQVRCCAYIMDGWKMRVASVFRKHSNACRGKQSDAQT